MKHLILILSIFISTFVLSQQSKQKFYDHLPLTKLNNYKTFNLLTSFKIDVEQEIKDLGYNFLHKGDSTVSFVNIDSSSIVIINYIDCSKNTFAYVASRKAMWEMIEDKFPYFEIYRAKRNFRHYYVLEEFDTEIAIIQIPFGHPTYEGKKQKKEKI
jgi:hypothetical protein